MSSEEKVPKMTNALKTLENLRVAIFGSLILSSCQLNLASMTLLKIPRRKKKVCFSILSLVQSICFLFLMIEG